MPFNDGDFSYFFTDIFAGPVQYGTRVSMCETMIKAGAGSDEELMQTVADLAVSSG